MKTKLTLILILSFLFNCSSFAIRASFSKVWIEHNVVRNGIVGIEFHFNAAYYNAKNRNVFVIASVDSQKGVGVSDTNGQYRLQNGVVGTSMKMKINSDPAFSNDEKLWMPVSELHIPAGIKSTWYVHLAIMVDKDPIAEFDINKILCWSDFVGFSVAGGANNKSNSNSNRFIYDPNARPTNPVNPIIPNNPINNGGSNISRGSNRITCPSCGGTGKGPDEITWQPNYTGGDNSRYCSICGTTTSAHSHRRPMCRTCYGHGYIE